jgi:hypothetical protein
MKGAITNVSEELIASIVKAENVSDFYCDTYGLRHEDGGRTFL